MDVQMTDETRELYIYLTALSCGGLLVPTNGLVMTLARCRNVLNQLILRDDFLRSGNQLAELIECATLQLAVEDDALFSRHELHHETCLQLMLKVYEASSYTYGEDYCFCQYYYSFFLSFFLSSQTKFVGFS